MRRSITFIAAIALSACAAVKLNGKTYGGGPASTGTSSTGGGSDRYDPNAYGASGLGTNDPKPPPKVVATAATACHVPWNANDESQGDFHGTPASPWLGVKGDRPAALPIPSGEREELYVRARRSVPVTCDAAHDHCLRECTWLVDQKDDFGHVPGGREPQTVVYPAHWVPQQRFVFPINPDKNFPMRLEPGYIAYRTVPATKRLLREGVKVVVADALPSSEVEGLGPWTLGTLDSVDWDAGKLYLSRVPTPVPVAAARVVVLEYRDGGKVQLASGFTRDEIVVKPGELLLPPTE